MEQKSVPHNLVGESSLLHAMMMGGFRHGLKYFYRRHRNIAVNNISNPELIFIQIMSL